jgi:uncharacterized membrane protein
MNSHEVNERLKFQLERVILFSDAVFAIAITLLIIEIHLPEFHGADATEWNLVRALAGLVPRFIGFLVSFMLIGMYWTRHHYLFGHVVRYTQKLLWLNLIFLLSIVLLPFSTGAFGEYSTPHTIHLITPLIIYVLNFCFTGAMMYWLWAHISSPANHLADEALTPEIARQAKVRAAIVPAVFALTIPVAFINPYVARYVPFLIPVFIRVFRVRGAKVGDIEETTT